MIKSFLMGGASIRKKLKRGGGGANTQQQSTIITPNNKFNLTITIVMGALILIFLILLSLTWWGVFGSKSASAPSVYTVQIVNEFPHDPSAFTQGLLYAGNDILFESTGLYGQSSVRKVNLHTGKVMAIKRLSASYFGEGLTLLGDRLMQVTWLKNTGFIYNRNNLSDVNKFTHQMQDGWGLATDGKTIFGVDGTSMLYQMDPQTFRAIDKKTVKYNGRAVPNLNELEYINDDIWSNIFTTDCIARISPENGNVHGWILLDNLRKGLEASGHSRIDVLNGIAWDQDNNRIFVTGKLWPKLYEIKLHRVKALPPGEIEQMCMPPPINFGRG